MDKIQDHLTGGVVIPVSVDVQKECFRRPEASEKGYGSRGKYATIPIT